MNHDVDIPRPHPTSSNDLIPRELIMCVHSVGLTPCGSKDVNPPRCFLSPLPPYISRLMEASSSAVIRTDGRAMACPCGMSTPNGAD